MAPDGHLRPFTELFTELFGSVTIYTVGFPSASKISVCWDPLQTLGVHDEQSESVYTTSSHRLQAMNGGLRHPPTSAKYEPFNNLCMKGLVKIEFLDAFCTPGEHGI